MSNTDVAAALVAKAEEMSAALAEWARQELLLGPGQQVCVTIYIRETSPVEIEFASGNYDRALTEEDWQKLLHLPWNTTNKMGAESLQLIRSMYANVSHDVEMRAYNVGSYNQYLQRLRAPYKFCRVLDRKSVRRGYNFYGLCGKSQS